MEDNGAVLSDDPGTPESGCSGSPRPCRGDDSMHNNNPAEEIIVTKVADEGGPVFLGAAPLRPRGDSLV
jgi:hypothetical protein